MTTFLATKFALSTAMLVLCAAIHALGLFSLSRALKTEANQLRLNQMSPLSVRGALFTFLIVLALMVIHGIEIWAYAALYMSLGAVSGLENAIYYSTISYSTVGYNDIHVAGEWRLLGAFESIVGMILLGWSTAFLFRVLVRIDAH